MATSREAFSQVKDILRKLDRSIDAARERRTGDPRPGSNGGASRPSAHQAPGRDVSGPSGS